MSSIKKNKQKNTRSIHLSVFIFKTHENCSARNSCHENRQFIVYDFLFTDENNRLETNHLFHITNVKILQFKIQLGVVMIVTNIKKS